MPSRPLMFVATPLVAVPIVWAFLLIGGGAAGTAGTPTAPPADQITSRPVPGSTSCGPPTNACSQGIALRPLEC